MNTRLLVLAVFFAAPVWADEPPKPAPPPTQQHMQDCNTQANEQKLTGSARRDFMRTCMHGSGATLQPRADPRADCRLLADKQGLKGTTRTDFMKGCVHGPGGGGGNQRP